MDTYTLQHTTSPTGLNEVRARLLVSLDQLGSADITTLERHTGIRAESLFPEAFALGAQGLLRGEWKYIRRLFRRPHKFMLFSSNVTLRSQ